MLLGQALEALVRPILARRGGVSDVDSVFTALMEELDGGLLTRSKAEELLEDHVHEELTGRYDGNGPITYRPGGEETFYGAGKW